MVKIAAQTLLEITALLAVSVAVGLGVNAARTDKQAVTLGRNYFPRATIARTEPPPAVETRPAQPVANQATVETSAAPPEPTALQEQIDPPESTFAGKHLGVHPAGFEQVREWFQDPKLAEGLYVFVDARDQGQFDSGRIPGAVLVDHYRYEHYLPDAIGLIQPAERVIVYCNGGNCEDSLFLSQTLIENGVEADRIYVFEGGFEQWEAEDMPVQRTEPQS